MIVLLPVDIQKGLDQYAVTVGGHSNPDFDANVTKLFAAARAAGRAIVHIKHNSTELDSLLRPGAPGNAFKPEAEPRPGEPVIEKTVNSAFIGTGLEQRLHLMGADHLVIFGMTTEHCVSTTVRMAGNLGFRTTLVGDATAAFPAATPEGETIDAATHHKVHLAALHNEFANVIDTKEAVSLLSRGS
ncbi:isochorismatase family protein [Hyphobacterium sp.]|jgi:nicotinamidase-related amidase|uniref:isochorismatase family protein n=1 Tax=Hyphobacterium sp. TaxID=2004662 RepID=UPI003BACF6F8